MSYTTIHTLPSRFIPYPPNVQIRYRPLIYNEVLYMSEHKGQDLSIISKFHDAKIIEVSNPMDFWDLTLGDWMFLLLSVVADSHIKVSYDIGRDCPHCKGKVEKIELDIPNSNFEVKGEVKRKLTPTEIFFKSLEDDVEMPIEIELSTGVAELDFIRMKHYRLKQRKSGKDDLSLLLNVPSDNLNLEDVQLISYARDYIEHGPENTIKADCQLCKKSFDVKVNWEAIDFLPFRPDEKSIRDRVSFGKRSKPGSLQSEETPVSSRDAAVQQSDRTSEQDKSITDKKFKVNFSGKPQFDNKR